MSSMTQKSLLAALLGAVSVSAHGHVKSIKANGQTIQGFSPFNGGNPTTPAWATTASDNGFVLPAAFGTRDIACHRGSKNGKGSITVAAGSTLTMEWDTWPQSHIGPVIDYMASCGSAGCETANVASLDFFKIAEAGLSGGKWASDKMIADGFKWDVTVPASLAPGAYVLRHEMIGLHEGDRQNGAQNYPQCVNLIVTGGGSAKPAGVKATALYKASDAGIFFNPYNNPTSYPIPGPPVFSAGNAGGNNGGNNGGNGNNGGAAPTTTTKAPTPTPTSSKGGNNGSRPRPTSGPVGDDDNTCASRKARRAARAARRAAVAKA